MKSHKYSDSAESQGLLTAVIDYILPPLQGYGGVQAGVPRYLEKILGDKQDQARATLLKWGLHYIQTEHRVRHEKDFAKGDDEQCRELLRDLAAIQHRQYQHFWHMLIKLSLQGFLSDPRHGGNRDGGAWRVIGFTNSSGTTFSKAQSADQGRA